jgi:hypothetical protein
MSLGFGIDTLVVIDDIVADSHTLIADKDGGACDQLADVILTFVAKRTSQ